MNGRRSRKAGLHITRRTSCLLIKVTFFLRGQLSQFVRKSPGERLSAAHINQFVKHSKKKMFWGKFTRKGVGSLVAVEGTMNTERDIDVLTLKAFPDLKRMFPNRK